MSKKKPTDEQSIILIKDRIIDCALKHINFDGWLDETILLGFDESKIDLSKYKDLFPRGSLDAILHFIDLTDRRMIEEYNKVHPAPIKVPEKIKSLILSRFKILLLNKEAVRRSLAVLSLPNNTLYAAKSLYNTTDHIWRTIGDKATDFSFYTKRGTLAGVYSSTLMSWVGNSNSDLMDVEEFLDRRLEQVAKFGKASKPVKDKMSYIFKKFENMGFSNFNRS